MSPPLPKPLIVCADDYAFSEGVSAAVLELARDGRLSATSAMVLSPRWAGDAVRLRELRGQIDVGLHLDWTSPFAHGAGHGLSLGQAMLRSLTRRFGRAQVTQVIERQLDAFEAHWQEAPDHVDGHQHVHQFEGLRQPLLEVLDRRYGRGLGPYLRVSQPVGQGIGLKGRVVGAMGAAALAREVATRGRGVAPALVGLYDFEGTTAGYAARVAGWLRDAPGQAVLMCHPSSRAEAGDDIGAARLREYEFWRSDAASAAMTRAAVVAGRGPAQPPAAP
jgi:predicted glycoside hydrolase/deacetylase ChbG (UPF0249 family)